MKRYTHFSGLLALGLVMAACVGCSGTEEFNALETQPDSGAGGGSAGSGGGQNNKGGTNQGGSGGQHNAGGTDVGGSAGYPNPADCERNGACTGTEGGFCYVDVPGGRVSCYSCENRDGTGLRWQDCQETFDQCNQADVCITGDVCRSEIGSPLCEYECPCVEDSPSSETGHFVPDDLSACRVVSLTGACNLRFCAETPPIDGSTGCGPRGLSCTYETEDPCFEMNCVCTNGAWNCEQKDTPKCTCSSANVVGDACAKEGVVCLSGLTQYECAQGHWQSGVCSTACTGGMCQNECGMPCECSGEHVLCEALCAADCPAEAPQAASCGLAEGSVCAYPQGNSLTEYCQCTDQHWECVSVDPTDSVGYRCPIREQAHSQILCNGWGVGCNYDIPGEGTEHGCHCEECAPGTSCLKLVCSQ